jgi:hypothetical protein
MKVVTEQVNATQHLFMPASGISDSLRKSARFFWESLRRRTGAKISIAATHRMCRTETPVELLREYQDWASGAYVRAMADGLARRELIAVVIAPPRPSGDEHVTTDASGPDSRRRTRSGLA